MDSKCGGGVRRRGISAWGLGAVAAMMVLGAGAAGAQVSHDTGVAVGAQTATKAEAKSYETLYLKSALHSSSPNDSSYEIVSDLRNMLPRAKVYYVAPQQAVSIYGTAEELALAKQVLAGVDRPVKSYKVTYTLTETGGGPATKTQHIAMLIASGGTAEVKHGKRVPIVTGSSDAGGKVETQVQYLDLGLSIRAKLSGGQSHLELDSRVGESQVVEKQTVESIQDPVIQQTMLTGTSTLAEGKTVSLGSLDIPASGTVGGQHMAVAVTVEPAG